MKVRHGFVSNSSSSSFCVLGIVLDDKYNIDEDVREQLESNTDLELVYGVGDYYEQQLMGIGPGGMKEDETLRQFKQRIVDEFQKHNVTVDIKDIDWHVDGGYDG